MLRQQTIELADRLGSVYLIARRFAGHADAAAGLPIPATVVTSDQVTHGKPDPECYRLAARKQGVPTRDCVVVEDAPAGLRAAKAAGQRPMP